MGRTNLPRRRSAGVKTRCRILRWILSQVSGTPCVQQQPLSTVGIVPPEDFPVTPYEAIHSVVSASRGTYRHSFAQFAGAWNAVCYRYLSCAEHDEAFTASLRRASASPPPDERYIQERELFGFFVTGLASIESLCYGLFAIGSMLDADSFPIADPKDMRRVDPKRTANRFEQAFPDDAVTAKLREMVAARGFRQWSDIRNILAHREAPGRHFYRGGPFNGAALWLNGIPLEEDFTACRRKWLAHTIGAIMQASLEFAQRLKDTDATR